MKIKMFMATSINGKITDENDSEDFLSNANWKTFSSLVNKTGCLIWGRKTYESVKKWDKKYLSSLDADIIVVSHSGKYHAKSPKDAIKVADGMGHKQVVVSGGAELNKSFLEKKLVDELYIDIEPSLVGKGKPFANEGKYYQEFILKDIVSISNGIIQLQYKIRK